MMNNYFRVRRSARGLSLIEAGLVMALSAVVLSGILIYASHASRQIKLRKDAEHFSEVMQAAEAYISSNRTTLAASASQTVTIADLKAAELLPAAFEPRVGSQQNMEILVRTTTAGGSPDVEALLISYGGRHNYADDEVGQIASDLGANAGFVPTGEVIIHGAAAGWNLPINVGAPAWNGITGQHAPPSSGHLVALVSSTSAPRLSNNWLARIDMGTARRYLNRMDTSLGMAGKATIGTTCPQAGWFNSTPGGDVVVCKMGIDSHVLKWMDISTLGSFNTFKKTTIKATTHHHWDGVKAQADRDMMITVVATESHSGDDDCGTKLWIEGTLVAGSELHHPVWGGGDKCTLSGFVAKGKHYQIDMNTQMSGFFNKRGKGYMVQYYHSD